MKVLLWLIIPLFLTALFFATSQRENLQETSPSSSVIEESLTKENERLSLLDTVSLSVSPSVVLQGEPVLIAIEGLINTSAISSLTFADTSPDIFENEGRLSALAAIDLHKTPGLYPVVLTLADGRIIERALEVKEREMATADFDIPESMGGNTQEGEQELSSNLASDTATLNAITRVVSPEKLWDGAFRYPRDEPIVITDIYGYSRQTGSLNISHNGTDFRAAMGTPVYAMNAGKAVFSDSFRNYGNTVIIDHGLGLMTMYMHLSEVNVSLNEMVEKGDLIAKSGNTGYSLAPHLHLSVRINGFSIDPEKFLELLGPK